MLAELCTELQCLRLYFLNHTAVMVGKRI